MCGKGGGSPPVPNAASTTFNSTVTPSAFVQPMYQDFLTRANTLSQTPFNTEMLGKVAPLQANQTAAGEELFSQGMSAGDFDPSKVADIQSPYTQQVVDATQNWFNNQNAIQSNDLLSGAIRSGNAFGGDRAGVAQGVLAGQQQLAQAPVIAGLYQAGYGQALQEYNTLKNMGLQGAAAALSWGNQQQQQQQREYDVAQQNAMMQSAYPFQTLNWYGSILGGVGPLLGSTASGSNNPPTPGSSGGLLAKRGGSIGHFADGGGFDSSSSDDEDQPEQKQTYTPPPRESYKRTEPPPPPDLGLGQMRTSGRMVTPPVPSSSSGQQQGGWLSSLGNLASTGSKLIDFGAKAAPYAAMLLAEGGPVRSGGVEYHADGDDVGDDIPEDYLAGRQFAGGDFRPTFYAPGPGDRMEGGFETSMRDPISGKNIPRTLDDYRNNRSDYVTVATDPSRYGQGFNIGSMRYRSPEDNKWYSLMNVPAISADTGSAFRGRPDKIDIATGDFRGYSGPQASNFVARNQAGNITQINASDVLNKTADTTAWPAPPSTGAAGASDTTTSETPPGWNPSEQTQGLKKPPRAVQVAGASPDTADVGQGSRSSAARTGSTQPGLRSYFPELDKPEKNLAQNILGNPLVQMLARYNAGTSPWRKVNFGNAILGTATQQEEQRRRDLLENKPEFLTLPSGEMAYRIGGRTMGMGMFDPNVGYKSEAAQRAQEQHEKEMAMPANIKVSEPGPFGSTVNREQQVVYDPKTRQVVPYAPPQAAPAAPAPAPAPPEQRPIAPAPQEQPPAAPSGPVRQTQAEPNDWQEVGKDTGALYSPSTGATKSPDGKITMPGQPSTQVAQAEQPAVAGAPAGGPGSSQEGWTMPKPVGTVTNPGALAASRNEEYLRTLKPDEQRIIKGIADYMIDPNKLFVGKNAHLRPYAMDAVKQYDSSYDQRLYATRATAMTEYTKGASGQNIKGINTVLEHMGDAMTAADKLGNSTIPIYNEITGRWAYQTGDKQYQAALGAFKTAADAAATEAAKTFRGVGSMSQRESELWQKIIGAEYDSPVGLRAAMKELTGLVQGRLNAQAQGWNQAMGPAYQLSPEDWMSPKAQETVQRAYATVPERNQPFPPSRYDRTPRQQQGQPQQQGPSGGGEQPQPRQRRQNGVIFQEQPDGSWKPVGQ